MTIKSLTLRVDYPRMDNLTATGQMIAQARAELDRLALIHCLLRATCAVAAKPAARGLSFEGEWNSDDEGGSDYYLSCKVLVESVDATPTPGCGEFEWLDTDDSQCSLAENVASILENWQEELSGHSFEYSNSQEFLANIGVVLMGADFYAWQASQEADELDEATGSPNAPSALALAL